MDTPGEIRWSIGAIERNIHLRSYLLEIRSRSTALYTYQTLNARWLCLRIHDVPCILGYLEDAGKMGASLFVGIFCALHHGSQLRNPQASTKSETSPHRDAETTLLPPQPERKMALTLQRIGLCNDRKPRYVWLGTGERSCVAAKLGMSVKQVTSLDCGW